MTNDKPDVLVVKFAADIDMATAGAFPTRSFIFLLRAVRLEKESLTNKRGGGDTKTHIFPRPGRCS